VLASAVYRLGNKPAVLGSLATLHGYARAWLRRSPRYDDLEFRRYIRRYHHAMLTRGRARALEMFNREADETWKRRSEQFVKPMPPAKDQTVAAAMGSDVVARDRG
jgi:hypothetical protein